MPDVGGRAEEIRAAEARLGLALPESVREFVALAHDAGCRGTATYAPERPTPLAGWSYELALIDGHAATSLMDCGDDDGSMLGVLHGQLDEADPPAHRFYHALSYDQNAHEWLRSITQQPEPWQPSVSSAILNNLTAFLPIAGRMFRADDVTPLVARLAQTFPVYAHWDGMDIFEADDIIVVIEVLDGFDGDGPPTRGARVHLRRPNAVGAMPDADFGLRLSESGALLFHNQPAPTAMWTSPARRSRRS